MDKDEVTEFALKLYNARLFDLAEADAWDGIEVPESGILQCWPSGIDGDKDLDKLSAREKEVLDEFTERFDLEILGNGQRRIVVREEGSDVVYKIGRCGVSHYLGDGIESNKTEVERFQSLNCDRLLPTLDWDDRYHWISMPFTRVLTEYPLQTQEAVSEKINETAENCEGLPDHQVDVENIGYWNGRWYMIDYEGSGYHKNVESFGLFP